MNAPHERTGALEAALEYGKRGWPVFQTFIKDEKLLPASAAKDGGPRWDATTDPEEINGAGRLSPMQEWRLPQAGRQGYWLSHVHV